MLDTLITIAWYVFAISILVGFHEYGHFWVARKLGVKVLRYSIGFGKVLVQKVGKDGCEYAISAIPLGGYVKLLGDGPDPVPEADHHQAFKFQPVWKRFLIVAAGPVANFLLAIVMFWAVFVVGQPGLKPIVGAPAAQSLAAKAGVEEGEVVLAVNDAPVATWTNLRMELLVTAVDKTPLRLTLQKSVGDLDTREVTLPMDNISMEPNHIFDQLGLEPLKPKFAPVIEEIMPNSAAARAGFEKGDLLVSRNGEKIGDWLSWATWVRERPGEKVLVGLLRDGTPMTLEITIGRVQVAPSGKITTAVSNYINRLRGKPEVPLTSYGQFGAGVAIPPNFWDEMQAVYRLGPVDAIGAGLQQTWLMSKLTLKMFGGMLTGAVSTENISGPIQTAQAASFSAKIGLATFLSFMAVVSVSLAVLNLLPVPVLDGGRLFFYTIEALLGRPLPDTVQAAGQWAGVGFVALLMGIAFFNDISRLIG